MNTLLSTKKLYKEYSNKGATCIAANYIDLQIEKGEFLTITGASGSGKSTLLLLLAGMTECTSGQVLYKNMDVMKFTDKQRAVYHGKETGFVFQDDYLLEELTILQNVALPGYLFQKKKIVDSRAEKWMQYLGIGEQKDKYPNQLSGGQRQRAAIARAVINNPKILFLDEPTGSLDQQSGRAVLKLLEKFHLAGQTIIMVTHDREAAGRGSRTIQVQDGRIIQQEIQQEAVTIG